ncbi:hypothetical protein ILUMI_24242 [Ignelater luminosus]|uniref:Nose resistant-to-fluoxetine protein N-terminal domain-containing protein n=1 Tax=Ignelater luminosus TaxID=2038154 RepID=A0A8K0CAX3_IGNLU|nr:hypothetical protein ILUMI_24242 [Ignelater luminosus]
MRLTNAIIFLLCFTSGSYGHTYNFDANEKDANSRSIFNHTYNISKICMDHIREYETSIWNGETWALQMLDASAKLPSSGILSANWIYLGDFDTCLSINHKTEILGKVLSWCLGIPFRNALAHETRMVTPDGAPIGIFAVCLPDSCSAEDFQEYYKSKLFKLSFFESLCTSKSSKPKLDAGDIATISFLSAILYIILMSTGYEIFTLYMKRKPLHPILTAFSLVINTKKLLQTTDAGQIPCLHGIRVISTMWVILGHRYNTAISIPYINPTSFNEWLLEKQSMIIMGATVSVDTFFLLSGLLISYGFLIATAKGIKFNIFVYYLHRFLRLTPLLAALVLIHATVLKHLGSGPLWNLMITSISQPCKTYWWSTLLYIQNYVNAEEPCIPQTWYLSVDTQLFLLSPLILLPLKHWPRIGLAITGVLTGCSIVACFTIGWIYELFGFMMANRDTTPYTKHCYYQPHTRAGPWLIGIILGYIIFEIKQKHRKISINVLLSVLLWLVSSAILLACVFTGQNMLEATYVYNKFTNVIYIALMRPGWALGVSWVIFACITGHGAKSPQLKDQTAKPEESLENVGTS